MTLLMWVLLFMPLWSASHSFEGVYPLLTLSYVYPDDPYTTPHSARFRSVGWFEKRHGPVDSGLENLV